MAPLRQYSELVLLAKSRFGSENSAYGFEGPDDGSQVYRSSGCHSLSEKSSRRAFLVLFCPCLRQNLRSNQPLGSRVQCQARPRSITLSAICFLPNSPTRSPRSQAKTLSSFGTGSVLLDCILGFLILSASHRNGKRDLFQESHKRVNDQLWKVALFADRD